MSSRVSIVHLFVLFAMLQTAGLAEAGKWPLPAGGVSASGDPELLLTFDDGPHEIHTTAILDTLAKFGLQAIFFWTGHRVTKEYKGLSDRRGLVGRAIREGHLIANHTSTHAKLCSVTRNIAKREIDDNAVLYNKLSGLPITLFRVPYGSRCRRLDGMLARRSLRHLHWDLDPQEFLHHSADIAFQYVTRRLKRLKPGMRAVLLMHDTQAATAKAMPRILKWIRQENKLRKKRGQRQIRIITGSQWVEEQQPVPLLRWAQDSVNRGVRVLRGQVTELRNNGYAVRKLR